MEPVLNLSEEKILNLSICFLCQKRKNTEKLIKTTGQGITALKNAAKQREEYGENNSIITRINSCLVNNPHINLSKVKYHSNCYKNFTSKDEINRLHFNSTK